MAAQGVAPVDRIVAVVNKDVITATELSEAVASAQRQLQRQGTPLPERGLLERQMLERLILDKAQLQLARDKGMRVDELQLDRAVQRVAQNNNMSLADFRRALERDNVPFQAWREELREQIVLTRLREREVDDRIQVSDTEIDLFLAELQAKPDTPRRIPDLAHPGARAGAGDARSASRRRAPGRRRRSTRRAPAPTSRASPRATRTRPTRCRAARSAGAATTGCPSCSPARSRRDAARRGQQRPAQPGGLPRAEAVRASRRRARRRAGRRRRACATS